MSANNKGLSVRILDKEYRIACPPGQEKILEDCAHQLDAQMRGVQQTGRVVGLDRIAIMAGLNLARKFLSLQNL
ncbi:MAG TPA: cell division protein ZapA, partial [Gammaproteobacteria bacterium]|nr:cell division protein ZapA [Gammaproteobacteria bacterium]